MALGERGGLGVFGWGEEPKKENQGLSVFPMHGWMIGMPLIETKYQAVTLTPTPRARQMETHARATSPPRARRRTCGPICDDR